jgi:hypothetical protein
MKYTLILLLFIGFGAKAQLTQDTTDARLLKYDSAIVIPLTPKNGISRQARFIGFSYNLESQQLHIMWKVSYIKNGDELEFYGRQDEVRYQIADANTYVDLTGQIIDTTGHPGPFMSEIDFYKMIAQRGTGAVNATINQLIIQAGLRPGKWKD